MKMEDQLLGTTLPPQPDDGLYRLSSPEAITSYALLATSGASDCLQLLSLRRHAGI